MAEMVCSALVQEAVSRGVSFGLGQGEEKASQGHIRERLEMAASELDFALEWSAKIKITDVSLLERRMIIKGYYVKATELLDKHKQQTVPASQEEKGQWVKLTRWIIPAKSLPTSSLSGLNTEDVRTIERYADQAGKFVRDVKSGSSLPRHIFFSPLVRHLLEGKTLSYRAWSKETGYEISPYGPHIPKSVA